MTDATDNTNKAEYNRRYYLENRERIRQQRMARAAKDPDAIKAVRKAWRDANHDRLRESRAATKEKSAAKSKAYYEANRERLKAKRRARYRTNVGREKAANAAYRRANPHVSRNYYLANKDARHKWHSAYQRRRQSANPNLRVYAWVMRVMNGALAKHRAGRRVTKQSRIVQLLGCEWTEFVSHIERQFACGMTWENHGRSGWHFDHITPLSSFDLTDEEQLRRGCHFTNVQPLWAADNVRKGAKIP